MVETRSLRSKKAAPVTGVEDTAASSTTPVTAATTATSSSAKPADEAFEFEFGGPLGALSTMVSLPLVIYGLYFACGPSSCALAAAPALLDPRGWPPLWDPVAAGILAGWCAVQAALERVMPCEVVEGVVLPDGRGRLTYRLNGHLAFWVSLLLVAHCWPHFDAESGALTGLGRAPLECVVYSVPPLD